MIVYFHGFLMPNCRTKALSLNVDAHHFVLRATLLSPLPSVSDYVIIMCIIWHVDILGLSTIYYRLVWFFSFLSLGTLSKTNQKNGNAKYQKNSSSRSQNVNTNFPFRFAWASLLKKHQSWNLVQVWKIRCKQVIINSCNWRSGFS